MNVLPCSSRISNDLALEKCDQCVAHVERSIISESDSQTLLVESATQAIKTLATSL